MELDSNIEFGDMNDEELFDLLDKIDYEKENKEISEIEKKGMFCQNCDTGDNIVEDNSNGIFVCVDCGSVISDIFDETPEWKQYADGDGKETVGRCSNPTNFFLPLSSLGTTIAGSNRNKIKILHSWSAMPYKERSLHVVLKEIQNKCRTAGIMKCIEDDAKILYKNISESKHLCGKNKGKSVIIRGVNRKSLIAACVFFACKRKGNTRSPKEIAKLFELKYKDITKGCKTFLKLIKMKHMAYDVQISNPEHFITRYCRELHITNEYINQTIKIAKNIQKLNVASMHTPFSVATGSILLVVDMNNLNVERKVIAKKFGVSEVTVLKTFREIEQYKNILLNDELTEKLSLIMEDEKKNLKVPDKLQNIYNDFGHELNYEEYISEEEYSDLKEIEMNNLDEYVDSINMDIYDSMNTTELEYTQLVNQSINLTNTKYNQIITQCHFH